MGAFSLAGSPQNALAQTFPSNAIRIVVASGPGTPPDIISRIVANEVQQSEGWRIVIENKVGAMQTLAGADVLKQPADGHTLVSVSLPGMAAPALLPSMNFSIEKEFAPVRSSRRRITFLSFTHPSRPSR